MYVIKIKDNTGQKRKIRTKVVNALDEGTMDPSLFVTYTPQTNGVPSESKLATYMVIYCFLICE